MTGQWRNSGTGVQAWLHVPMLRMRRARPEIQMAVVHGGPVAHSKHIISRIRAGLSIWEGLMKTTATARPHLHPRAVWLNCDRG